MKQAKGRSVFKHRLYFVSSRPQVFMYSTDYMERLKTYGDPALIDAYLNGDWDVASDTKEMFHENGQNYAVTNPTEGIVGGICRDKPSKPE